MLQDPKNMEMGYFYIEGGVVVEYLHWECIWRDYATRLRPDPNLAVELGIDIKSLPEQHDLHSIENLQCPFCGSHYVTRLETRPYLKERCDYCQGEGERVLKMEAMLEGYLEQITKDKEAELAEFLADRVKGVFQMEFSRIHRLLKLNQGDEKEIKRLFPDNHPNPDEVIVEPLGGDCG